MQRPSLHLIIGGKVNARFLHQRTLESSYCADEGQTHARMVGDYSFSYGESGINMSTRTARRDHYTHSTIAFRDMALIAASIKAL